MCSDRLKAHGFRDSFTLLVGVLFTFPSRYSFTVGLTGVFSLAGGSRRIRAGFLVSRVTQDTAAPGGAASGTGLSPAAGPLSSGFPSPRAGGRRGPTTPARRRHRTGLGWSPVARRYWGNHCLFSLPGGTGMFRFPPFAPARDKRAGDSPSDCRVVPFGHLRVTGHLHLTADFRSLPRPSSPP